MNSRPPTKDVPQPHPSRITPFANHPIVVGVTLSQARLVLITAAEWAKALNVTLFCAYVDPTRMTLEEYPDGTVRHGDINPDLVGGERWQSRETKLRTVISDELAGTGVTWEFRYLAGRVDRSLTHLARAVNASAFVIGAQTGSFLKPLKGSIAQHLAHHQHRPVLVVPTAVVDWKTPIDR